MITPPFLKHGDTIGLVSTARKITLSEIEPAINCLTKQGFHVILAPNIFAIHHQFAGTDEQRSSDFQWMINNTEVKAILCVRGGYGTARIIDSINFIPLLENPKWVCGYSDVTVLHAHLQHLELQTLHCTMPINFPTDGSLNESVSSMLNVLHGKHQQYEFPHQPLNRVGTSQGNIIGGNLSILYSIMGSPSDINTDGKILFIEDLDEYLYHIDRMMISLKRNGKLSNLAGLMVGGLSDMHDNAVPFGKTAEEIICDAVDEYNYPVCYGLPAGHIDPNMALIIGGNASLNITAEQTTISFNL
jgi:muramoyltetrapeptide carboxypeptidase